MSATKPLKPVMRIDSKVSPIRVLVENEDGTDISEQLVKAGIKAHRGDIISRNNMPLLTRGATSRRVHHIGRVNNGDENRDTYECHPSVWAKMPDHLKDNYEPLDIDAEMASLSDD